MSVSRAGQTRFRLTTVEIIFAWFQRIMAAYCLLFGVLYWIRLIGIYPGALWRFDLMPIPWQVVTVMLSVFFPFAAAGLWILASWGPVIWFICAATEITMFAGFPDLFGRHLIVVAAHLLAATLYAAFRIVIHIQKLRASGLG